MSAQTLWWSRARPRVRRRFFRLPDPKLTAVAFVLCGIGLMGFYRYLQPGVNPWVALGLSAVLTWTKSGLALLGYWTLQQWSRRRMHGGCVVLSGIALVVISATVNIFSDRLVEARFPEQLAEQIKIIIWVIRSFLMPLLALITFFDRKPPTAAG